MPFVITLLLGASAVWLTVYGLQDHHAKSLARESRAAARPELLTADSRRRMIESLYRPELIGDMVRHNNLNAIRQWISRHPGDKGAFFGAGIAEGKPEVMSLLLGSGFRPNNDPVQYRDGAGRACSQPRLQLALATACARGHAAAVGKLLDMGTSPNGSDTLGCPLLALAAARGHTDVVQILLDRGAAVDSFADIRLPAAETSGEETKADSVTRSNEIERVRHLAGKTALHLAAEYHHPRIVQLLLDHRANARRLTPTGLTALQLCRKSNPPAYGIGIRERPGATGRVSPEKETESILAFAGNVKEPAYGSGGMPR